MQTAHELLQQCLTALNHIPNNRFYHVLQSTSTYELAALIGQYFRSQPPKPRILIEITGGKIDKVYTPQHCDIIVINHDHTESDQSPVTISTPNVVVTDGVFINFFQSADPRSRVIHNSLKTLQDELNDRANNATQQP